MFSNHAEMRIGFEQTTGLRHAVRTLKHGSISQTDWHGGQILCPALPNGSRRIVLLDFAFALTWLGDVGGIPYTRDYAAASGLMYKLCHVSEDVLYRLWTPCLEMED